MTYLITGATGQLGRRAADLLVDRVDPAEAILTTRRPDALTDLALRGADVRYCDFDRPESLAPAFAGATRMLLISTDSFDGSRVGEHARAIDAAKAAGVEHIAYTSYPNPVPESPSQVAPDHRETEEYLAASGVSYTFLRNALYSSHKAMEARGALAGGNFFHNLGEGATTYVAYDDCAESAVAVLTGGPEHDDQIYDITGSELLDGAGLAAVYAAVGGTPIEAVAVDDAAWIDGAVGVGIPRDLAEMLASFGAAIRGGFVEIKTDTVEQLTGHPPRSLADEIAPLLQRED
jgi:NAD(P)H dehydrogenase (quinone)